MKSLQIRVPCSTSNLGPGFDLLGLALGLFLDVEASPISGAHRMTAAPGHAQTWPTTDGLVQRAFDAAFAQAGFPSPPQHFQVASQIPVARGLGSSGAAVAAGLILANARLEELHNAPLSAPALHAIGIAIEGHPDNVTASLYGGCTLCLPANAGPRGPHPLLLVKHPLAEALRFVIAWGNATTTTEQARQILPAQVTFDDAVENPRRLAMLLEGLRTGDPQLLAAGAHDRLHHTARLALIPGGAETLAAAESKGAWLTAISGSGSSLVAICSAENQAFVAAAMEAALAPHDPGAQSLCLELVNQAPKVQL